MFRFFVNNLSAQEFKNYNIRKYEVYYCKSIALVNVQMYWNSVYAYIIGTFQNIEFTIVSLNDTHAKLLLG